MPTLGPQIVSQSYGNLLKFLPTGSTGVTTNQVQITDGKGKVTPLYLATGSVLVDNEFTASAEVVFSGLTQVTQTNIVCIDGSGRLYFQNSASFQDNDWTVGSSYMTASGQDNVYIPNKLENGLTNNAQGAFSHAEGANTIAIGDYSHAEGRLVSASGTWSHAEGNKTKAQQNYSHAEGNETISYGFAAHAEGWNTLASESYSHAEGQDTKAMGIASHAEGASTRAIGDYSHAEGGNTIAIEYTSHAGGRHTTASLVGQTVVGQYNIGDYPNGNDTFVVGAGLDSSMNADGLKVRADVITSILSTVLPSSPVIIRQSFNSVIPSNNHSGLYFGDNGVPGSHRVTSDVINDSFNIELHNGVSYINIMQINSTSTAVFNT